MELYHPTQKEKDNIDGYDKAIDGFNRGNMPRQLARAKFDMTRDCWDQLEEAFIFHYAYAWRCLKYSIKQIIRLRCPTCGRRHFFKPLHIIEPRYQLHCFYGWWYGVKTVLSRFYLTGKHGED